MSCLNWPPYEALMTAYNFQPPCDAHVKTWVKSHSFKIMVGLQIISPDWEVISDWRPTSLTNIQGPYKTTATQVFDHRTLSCFYPPISFSYFLPLIHRDIFYAFNALPFELIANKWNILFLIIVSLYVFRVRTHGDKAAWSFTDGFCYPKFFKFNKTCARAEIWPCHSRRHQMKEHFGRRVFLNPHPSLALLGFTKIFKGLAFQGRS